MREGRFPPTAESRARAATLTFFLQRQEAGVAAGGGGVGRDGALGREAVQVAGAAGFGAGAGEAFAAARLHADDGADPTAVDVSVADLEAREDVAHGLVDPAVDAEGQAVAGSGYLVEHRVETVGMPAHDMEDRAEDLPCEPRRAVDLEGLRRDIGAVPGTARKDAAIGQPALVRQPRRVTFQRLL